MHIPMSDTAGEEPAPEVLAHEDALTCAICLDSTEFVVMPCCGPGHESSTTRFCARCVEVICDQAGGVGRCPRCRAWISVEASGAIVQSEARGTCLMCRQSTIIIAHNRCDACLLGDRHRLQYECDRCHRLQMIPHPMWRHQETPEAFGGATWACHGGCGDYTHWRVAPHDVARVPADDAPESWGVRDEWLARVRAIRNAERTGAHGAAQAVDANDIDENYMAVAGLGCTMM